ncbi:unnamed protein product [Schistosoma margrebowiei]|uniref:Uncharacterized protein n=1 Tax=Schistosoma margrebowiei TaxID=48269 RepID=A0A183MGS6_9TREM|nr:unnamed protein product [Schistosoma margrebowiei]
MESLRPKEKRKTNEHITPRNGDRYEKEQQLDRTRKEGPGRVRECRLVSYSPLGVTCGYFKYYWDKKDSPDKNNIESDPSLKGVTSDCNESQELVISINKSGILSTMKETFLPGICVLITLMITLSLFPAVVARIRPITVIPQDLWTSKLKMFSFLCDIILYCFASPGNQESAGAALSIYLSFGLSLGVAVSVGLVQCL